jgi:siderophore synthetase component
MVSSKRPTLLLQTVEWLQQRGHTQVECEHLLQRSYLYSLSRFIGACLREGIFTTYVWRTGKLTRAHGTAALILRGRRGEIRIVTNAVSDPLYLRILGVPELVINRSRRLLETPKEFFRAIRSIVVTGQHLPPAAMTLFENSQAHLLIGFARNSHRRRRGQKRISYRSNYVDQETLCEYGHPLYPFPKLRERFGLRDALLYSNEHRKGVALRLVSVPNRNCLYSSQLTPNSYEFYQQSLGSEIDVPALKGDSRSVIPVHPWQLRNVPFLKELLKRKSVSLLPGCLLGKPLVSLRTLHLPTSHLDVKVSLSTTITSEKRVIHQFQSQNAPLISRLLTNLIEQLGIDVLSVQEDLASFRYANFLYGPALTAIFREPVVKHRAEKILSAAYLYDGIVGSSEPVITRMIKSYEAGCQKTSVDFFRRYAKVLLEGPLKLLHVGVGVEPHPQNCLIVFKNSQPNRLILRDTDSSNLIPARLSDFVVLSDYKWYPETWKLMQSQEFGIARFWHAAIRSHIGSLIHVIVSNGREDERRLWQELRRVLEELLEELVTTVGGQTERITQRLFGKYEPIKCLLRMKFARSERFILERRLNPLWHSTTSL